MRPETWVGVVSLVLSAATSLRSAGPIANGAVLRLDEVLSQVEERHPGLRSMRDEARAAVHLEPQVGSLPDPMLTGMAAPELDETRIEVSQAFPLAGKRRLRARGARLAASAAAARYEAERLRLRYEATEAFFDLWVLVRSIEATRENRKLLESWRDVMQIRYAGGRGGQQGVVKVELEIGLLEDRLRSLSLLEPGYAEALNALLDRPPGTPVPRPDPEEPHLLDLSVPAAELDRWAGEANPEVVGMVAERDRMAIEERLARKAKVPDLTVGLRYTREAMPPDPATGLGEDRDQYMSILSINLPVRRARYRALEEEARLRRVAAAGRVEGTRNQIEARIHRAYAGYQDARRRIDLYAETLIPRVQQAMQAALAEYQTGTGALLDVVDSERQLLDFRLVYAEAVAEHRKRLAELDMLVGRPVLLPAPASDPK